MFGFLKNHPFAVEAFFERSMVLTFAVPKEQLQRYIPECLTLDTFQDTWAFCAMAMVQTRELRPKGFPRILGADFFLIGYRVFVRYRRSDGRLLRGLYILKSETDSKRMERAGNLFTHYNYTTTDIRFTDGPRETVITSVKSGLEVVLEKTKGEAGLPAQSPFSDLKEARRYAGPLPFTFTYNRLTREVLIIEGVREGWVPKPVQVLRYRIPFIDGLKLEGARLANGFVIEQIPYYWKKGVIDIWK